MMHCVPLTGESVDIILLTKGATFPVGIYLGNNDFILCMCECIGELLVDWRKVLKEKGNVIQVRMG